MIERSAEQHIRKSLKRAAICYLAGPRQVGKTTLARRFLPFDHPAYFDLEDPASIARLEAPKAALNQDTPLTVIDEIQLRPDLFPLLRVLSDSPDRKTAWLILGSASPSVLKGVAESLTGRVELINLSGFSLREVGHDNIDTLLVRGGFPRSYLADTSADSLQWRKQFINMIVSRDLPSLGVQLPQAVLVRLFTMMAHWHGQVWNAAEPARSLGISETTVHRLTDFFEGLYFIRQLRPWHANLKKRQVKRPKLYIRDSGLCQVLLGIRDRGSLYSHPKAGAVWEGFVMETILDTYEPDEAWFWATHNGAELDLLLVKNGRRTGFEIKISDAPKLTPSMGIALQDLELENLYVVHGGIHSWDMADRVRAVPMSGLPEEI